MAAWHGLALALLCCACMLHDAGASAVSLCRSWNINGARMKLREYPMMAGPLRTRGPGNFSACYSATLQFTELATNRAQYLVLMDGYDDSVPCEEELADLLRVFGNATQAAVSSFLNTNQQIARNYSYVDGWVQCCNDTNMCNQVINPPTFIFNESNVVMNSCNAFNLNRGWRFFNNPANVGPITRVTGNFTNCYSITVQLLRGTQSLYYVELAGYDPNQYDGITSCNDWVNQTLRTYRRDNFFVSSFNLTIGDSWFSCCNTTDCNRVVIPPALGASQLLPQLLLQAACLMLAVAASRLFR